MLCLSKQTVWLLARQMSPVQILSCYVQFDIIYVVSTSVESEDLCSTTVIVQAAVQLIPPLFFSATSSICLILLSKTSILLASLRARS